MLTGYGITPVSSRVSTRDMIDYETLKIEIEERQREAAMMYMSSALLESRIRTRALAAGRALGRGLLTAVGR